MERSTKRQKLASVRQQLFAVDPWVSARSSTRPRRRCVLAASTCMRRHRTRRRRRRGTAWNGAGGDQRRRRRRFRTSYTHHGVASSAQRQPSSSASQRRRLTVDGEPLRITAGRRKWSRLLVTRVQSARHVDIRHDVCSSRV